MKIIRTVKLKLNLSPKEFQSTLSAYSNAFDFICQYGYYNNVFQYKDLHDNTYYECRELFNLPSQLVITAIHKASEALKAQLSKRKGKKNITNPHCPKAKNISIRYDCRSYSLYQDFTISLLTIKDRIKTKIIVPNRDFHYFSNWKRGAAEFFIRKNSIFLNITFSKIVAETSPDGEVVGIDRGINNLAATSNNKIYSGKKLKILVINIKIIERNYKAKTQNQQEGTFAP